MVSSQGSPTKIPLPPQESPHSSMDHLRFEAEELLAASDMLPPTSFLYKLHFSNKPSESIDAQLLFNFLKENKLATFRVYLLSFFKKCFSLYAKLGAFETLSLLTENDHQLWQETSFLDEELKSEILGYLKNNTEWSGRFLPKIHEFIVKLVIKEVKSENEWPELTQFLHQSLGNGSEEKVEFSLHLLCKLIPQCTVETWLSTNLHQVVESVFKFLGKAELQEKTRLLALEFVVTLAEGGNKGRKMLLDSPLFIKELIKRILGLLEVIEDDPEWETAQSDDRSQGLTSVSATNTLSRIAAALDGQVLLSTFLQPFFSHLEDVEWKRRLAAVNFLAIIADSCSKLQVP
ncbi:unnamed protein product [Dovyalis caffra]|uniref:HEAT repeat-containing protein 1 n=1 Tax=Dovyalis caffra TaxID=77055 RepID=A0AAV1QSX9_9ROSI|nr:unnamed protein product [Dovyalis caffra]